MTVDVLRSLLIDTTWFGRLAEPGVNGDFVQIFTLGPWANVPTDADDLERIADQMDWLPSSREQDDPIHRPSLEERAEQLGMRKEISRKSLDIYRVAVSALGRFKGHPALKVGPHDFTEAARGAALFAVRQATYEILVNEPGFWCRLMEVYHAGHWPCGILPGGKVVVL
ncbi:hypothetical protein V5E97_18190 [Singulisphaera sp. Ch08]|uniref:Uncharacterized protein n=1 Tax=Singulisphaera sp. Ch08 TaxID=3120278 RepID=A0AAU7CRG9_9BACT